MLNLGARTDHFPGAHIFLVVKCSLRSSSSGPYPVHSMKRAPHEFLSQKLPSTTLNLSPIYTTCLLSPSSCSTEKLRASYSEWRRGSSAKILLLLCILPLPFPKGKFDFYITLNFLLILLSHNPSLRKGMGNRLTISAG